VDRDFRFKIFN